MAARGYCDRHYQAARRRAAGKPTRKRQPNGTPHRDQNGYVVIHRPGHPNARKSGQIFEHRFVMAEMLGRPLLPGETAHHKNGVKHDNRPSNLELWVSFQPAGQRPQDLLEWADEIYRRYGVADVGAVH